MSEVGPGEAIEQKVALLVRAWLETKRKTRVAEQERLHVSRPDARRGTVLSSFVKGSVESL